MHWYYERDNILKANVLLVDERRMGQGISYICINSWRFSSRVTIILLGTKYQATNLYFMNSYLVRSAIIEATVGINSYMAPMLKVMREKFMKYLSDYSVFCFLLLFLIHLLSSNS